MRKIDQKKEKQARNEVYAKRFEKPRQKKGRKAIWINWCRTLGHPSSCQCVYPRRSEIPTGR